MKKSIIRKFMNINLPGDIAGHSVRVCALSVQIAKELMKRDPSLIIDLETLEVASLFHDVGKPAIRSEILHKPGPLTVKEKNEMNQHVKFSGHYAYKYHLGSKVTKVILRHHERCDGSGYPFGIEVSDIETKILMIADVFDALTSNRSYRKAFSLTVALEEMEKEKQKYDPLVMSCFLNFDFSTIEYLDIA